MQTLKEGVRNKIIEVSDYNPSAKKTYKKDEKVSFGFKEDSIHIIHK